MEKILVSACLLGDKCRYDGGDNFFPFIKELQKHYELVAFCPEMEANLGCPRKKAEILNDRVITEDGRDITSAYESSADKAVRLCSLLGIHIAILKDRSPACGSRYIHNGLFKGNVIEGLGVTARALIRAGVHVYAETDALEFLLPKESEKKEPTKRYKIAKETEKEEFDKKPSYKKKDDKKPAYKKPYDKKPSFKKDDDRKPFKKKEFDKKPYHKDKENKPYEKKKGNAYHKERSFSRNKAQRNNGPYNKKTYDKK